MRGKGLIDDGGRLQLTPFWPNMRGSNIWVICKYRGAKMTLENQLESLRKEHDDLSRQVEIVQSQPGADTIALTEMKKRKLHLKEKIFALSKD